MRSILSKATVGAMIAGAALLVSACGGSDTNVTSNNVTDMGNDVTMDANAMDQGMDANAMDANASTTTNTSTTTTDAGGNATTTNTSTTTNTQ